jgi:ABC-type glycerol-3-phosphate transport system permease component
MVDGATQIQVLRHILLPLIAPAATAVAAFVFLMAWGEYLFAVSLITSTDFKTLPLALQAAFGQYSIDWGMLIAGGAIISLPPALLFMFFQRYLVGGLTAGGVKG